MSRFNPLADLPHLAYEVRDGYRTLLRVLVGIGDLLANPDHHGPADRWVELRRQLEGEGRL